MSFGLEKDIENIFSLPLGKSHQITPQLASIQSNIANSATNFLERNQETLNYRLQKCSDQFIDINGKSISLRELKPGESPKVDIKHGVYASLENAFLIKEHTDGNKECLYFGDAHGAIFSHLNHAVKLGILSLPLNQGGILNVDFHSDIAQYGEYTQVHTASWQRFGVEQGFWSANDSFNWQPEESDAVLTHVNDTCNLITPIKTPDVSKLKPQVISVDLDFFNDLDLQDPRFSNYFKILCELIKKSKIVMIFSSSGWVAKHQKPEQIKFIIEEIINIKKQP